EGQSQLIEECVQVLRDEVGILKEPQKSEIAHQADDQPKLSRSLALALFHEENHHVVDGRCAEEQQKVIRVPPAVKGVRGGHQPKVHQLIVLADNQIDGVD